MIPAVKIPMGLIKNAFAPQPIEINSLDSLDCERHSKRRIKKLECLGLTDQQLDMAAREVDLLEAIAAYPNNTTRFYAQKINCPVSWAGEILKLYRSDGVVISTKNPDNSFTWRLT